MPEGKRHLRLRTALFQILEHELGHRAAIGSDQFVYWNAADPRRCLAPDAFVRLNAPNDDFETWKTWERGAPHVAVEISSPSDTPEGPWERKLERYHELGIQELVRYNHEDLDAPLQIWDRVDNDLVERALQSPTLAHSEVLDLWWVVAEREGQRMLRLSRDAAGLDLVPTPEEGRQAEARARQHAEERVRELEAALRRKG